jgi:hypothetical protein
MVDAVQIACANLFNCFHFLVFYFKHAFSGMFLVFYLKKMATATKKKAAAKKSATKKSAAKKGASKRSASKKSAAKKGSTKRNKLGVKNSLVNNINAHKKRGDSKSKKKSSVEKKQYKKMENDWGKDK